jgi:lipopolysaccharide biosynthesis glycosyltransferase
MSKTQDEVDAVAIAFCSDPKMEVALHVAASSILTKLSRAVFPKVYLMLDDFSPMQIAGLRNTLDAVGRSYELVLLDTPDVNLFHGLRPFYGSYAAYYRMLLPDLITEDRFLYLDLDTITNIDVAPLFTADMQGYAMGFITDGQMQYALEKNFFYSVGKGPEDKYFNSGVMLVDTARWKAQGCLERILGFCRKYPTAFDQTILNALYSEDCYSIPVEFNICLSSVHSRGELGPGIYHFFGSPKPWDLFGSLFHPYYSIWAEALKKVPLSFRLRSPWFNRNSWRRLPKIVGGYRRIIKQRMQAKGTR